ncbi:MAG: GNAT family N-acetyltransferase [Desulfobacterales bacterium]|nr:MAG: GNAT family N-acetyltransferase [Desulfobacterales bacterium]
MVRIIRAHSQEHFHHARRLFRQYADSLEFDLEFQGFRQELASLPGDYAPPAGSLLLAESSGNYVGCVALRPLTATICEMKRLFVAPEYRGQHIGRELARSVIDAARRSGYEYMRLDTVDSMTEARALYRSLGFRAIEAYCYNPLENPMYMELDLRAQIASKQHAR